MAWKSSSKISIWMLVVMTIAPVVSLRALSMLSGYGISSTFFYAIAGLCFFLPLAFVCAELATGWPKAGSVYGWVKEAFGERGGFIAVWLQWAQSIVWYPIVLSFFAATFCFIFFDPKLSNNPIFISLITIAAYWIANFISSHGIETLRKISSLFIIFGTLIPTVLLIACGILWIALGNAPQTALDLGAFIPATVGIGGIVIAISAFTSFAGVEVSAVHASNLRDPKKEYPRAIFIAGAIIFLIFVLGTISISIIVPHSGLNIVTGIIVAFNDFLSAYNLGFLVPIIALMICFGILGQVTAWFAGPSKGLLQAAKNGNLPKFFHYENSQNVPTNILWVQGVIVSALAISFMFVPSVQLVYWMLTDLVIHLYLLMYVILFAAAIKLRYSAPNIERPFKIPFGNAGMWTAALIGIASTICAFLVGFFPPSQLPKGWVPEYEIATFGIFLLLAIVPLILNFFGKKSWVAISG